MSLKTIQRRNPVLKSEMGLTPVYGATISQPISYSIKPKPEMVLAKFVGVDALCGNCHRKIGEFTKAEGVIMCKNVNNGERCKTLNRIVK